MIRKMHLVYRLTGFLFLWFGLPHSYKTTKTGESVAGESKYSTLTEILKNPLLTMRLCAVKCMLNICFHLTVWIRNLLWCRLPGMRVINVIISASLDAGLPLRGNPEQPQAWWRTEQSRMLCWVLFLTCAFRCFDVLLTSSTSAFLGAGQHPVDPVGVAAPLSAVLPQLTDVRQRVQRAVEVRLPCFGIWLVFAGTVPT